MGNTKGEIVGIGTYTPPVLYHTNPEVSSMYIEFKRNPNYINLDSSGDWRASINIPAILKVDFS